MLRRAGAATRGAVRACGSVFATTAGSANGMSCRCGRCLISTEIGTLRAGLWVGASPYKLAAAATCARPDAKAAMGKLFSVFIKVSHLRTLQSVLILNIIINT